MDDAYVGSIMAVAHNRIPYGWVACDGAVYDVRMYPALYSLIGNTYGGSVQQGTFAVPALNGRTLVGSGQGPGLPPISLGEMDGANAQTALLSGTVPLNIGVTNLPQQALTGTLNPGTLGVSSTLYATSSGPGSSMPVAGAMLSNSGTGAASAALYYVNPTPAVSLPSVPLSGASVTSQVSGNGTFAGAISQAAATPLQVYAGASTAAIPVMQPTLGLGYIVCAVPGVYPVRP